MNRDTSVICKKSWLTIAMFSGLDTDDVAVDRVIESVSLEPGQRAFL